MNRLNRLLRSRLFRLRPWHTANFFRARLLLFGVWGMGFAVARMDMVFLFLCLLAATNALSLWRVTHEENAVPAPFLDSSEGCGGGSDTPGGCLALFIFAFVMTLFLVLTGSPDSRNVAMRFVFPLQVLLLNGAGWYLLAWGREAVTLQKRYNALLAPAAPRRNA